MPVSFSGWAAESLTHLREGDGPLVKRFFRPLYYLYVGGLLTVENKITLGTNIFERDWDLLIILDACRVDAIEQVRDNFEFIETINSIWSVGSTSFEWMPLTFQDKYKEEIKNTVYITGNPYTQRVFEEKLHPPIRESVPFGPKNYNVVESSTFKKLDELWKLNFDGSFNRVPPRVTTDRAITAGREIEANRFIVHYMYPHNPYPLAKDCLQKPFPKLRRGGISRETVWELYIENLEYVLLDIQLLLENFEAEKVVISADHGEAFGEYGFYKHDIGCPIPSVRKVPWITTTSQDTNMHSPGTYEEGRLDSEEIVSQRLKDLGYL